MYKKCGTRESSEPGLLNTASWNCSIKNIPNALDAIIPSSPFLEHAVITCPSRKALSKSFGFEAQLHPKNIINNRKFEINTPDVSIKVNPERSDLIETRIIGGVKYILICADENVEVNGVNIHFEDKEAVEV